jgi:hypothetical protein
MRSAFTAVAVTFALIAIGLAATGAGMMIVDRSADSVVGGVLMVLVGVGCGYAARIFIGARRRAPIVHAVTVGEAVRAARSGEGRGRMLPGAGAKVRKALSIAAVIGFAVFAPAQGISVEMRVIGVVALSLGALLGLAFLADARNAKRTKTGSNSDDETA